ncbi:MAG: hypothetical protein ABIJ11_07215 [Elusimicrobiota bacterium]
MNGLATIDSYNYGLMEERKKDIPVCLLNFLDSTQKVSVKTGLDIAEDKNYVSEKISSELIPLWSINIDNKCYKLTKPLKLNIFRDNNLWVVENETLSIYGDGESPEEAVNKLKTHIAYYYRHYKNLPKNRLIGRGINLKNLYENLLQETR